MGHRFSNRKSLDQWSNPSNIQSDTFPVKFSIIIRGFTLHDEQYNSGNANQNFTGRWIAIGK